MSNEYVNNAKLDLHCHSYTQPHHKYSYAHTLTDLAPRCLTRSACLHVLFNDTISTIHQKTQTELKLRVQPFFSRDPHKVRVRTPFALKIKSQPLLPRVSSHSLPFPYPPPQTTINTHRPWAADVARLPTCSAHSVPATAVAPWLADWKTPPCPWPAPPSP